VAIDGGTERQRYRDLRNLVALRVHLQQRERMTIALVGVQATVAVVAVLVNIAAARALGPSGRGLLAFWLQLAYLAGGLSMLGIDRPYVAGYKHGFSRSVGDMLRTLLPLLVALLVLDSVLWSAFLIFRLSDTLLFVFASGLLVGLGVVFGRILRAAYIASGRLAGYVAPTMVMQAVILASGLCLLAFGVTSPGAWLAVYAAAGIAVVGTACISGLRGGLNGLSGSEIAAVRRFGLKLVPASLGNTAMLRSDRLLLPILSTTTELGLYVVVATIMELAALPVQNYVDAALFHWTAAAISGQLRLARTATLACFATAVAATAMGLGCIAIIQVILGQRYASSESLVLPLAVASVIYAASRVFQGALIADGRGGAASASEVGGMLVSVAAYLALIPGLGAMGAAIGSVIGYSGCTIITAVILFGGRGWQRKQR
jgi:O-antigen/teichoic acid export membrane protein